MEQNKGGRTRYVCRSCGLRIEGAQALDGRIYAYDRAGWNGKVEECECMECHLRARAPLSK